MNSSKLRVFAALVLLLGASAAATAQSPNCAVLQGSSTTQLPNLTNTLPGSGDLTTAGGSEYLYVLTQWGVTRAALTNPGNPSPYSTVFNIGAYAGSPGVIPIHCDCFSGASTFDVAQEPGGTSRMITDWPPYNQAGGPGSPNFSGLPGHVVETSGTGATSFGQQINLSNSVPTGGRVAAVYIASTDKYFGYFPLQGGDVYKADITDPTGAVGAGAAIEPTFAIAWNTPGGGSSTPVRPRAVHVQTTSYNEYILVGATDGGDAIHVAEINPSSGQPTEVASGPYVGFPSQLDVAVVDNRIFIFSAEGSSGLRVYEYLPTPGLVVSAGSIPGIAKRVAVRGPAPFPAVFFHRSVGGSESYIDIYDTKWLTQGGSPLLAKSLRHFGASDAIYRGQGFEALVTQQGATLTAYVYRETTTSPQMSIHTDTVDISCIAADPDAPPVPLATMTNLSAAGRPSPENAKTYYGDKWQIKDSSVSYLPITELDWDFHYTGAFVPEVIANPPGSWSDINPAWWPCDELTGGDIKTGTGCYQSLGAPAANYQLALRSKNGNLPDPAPTVSPAISVLAPQVNIVGFSGNVLQVLAGNPNNGDASGSQGNTADATFAWTFTPSGSASGKIVTVPLTATAFSLTVTYKGGYAATKSGSVLQVDLVPNFSAAPNPVLKSSPLTLQNLMQKAAAAVVVTVSYAITGPQTSSGILPSTFWLATPPQPAQVTAPSAIGNYTMTLTYNYTDHLGSAQVATVAKPFSVTDFQPNPSVMICRNNSVPCNLPAPFFGDFNLTLGTTYHLSDIETLPGGVTHPGAAFFKSTNSSPSTTGDTLIGSSSGAGPVTFVAQPACSSSCYIKVSVSGFVGVASYIVEGGPPPPPPPTTPTLSLTGPGSGVTGSPVTFTAVPTNYTPTSFSWDFGDGGAPPPPPPPPPGDCPPIIPNCNATAPPEAASAPGPNPNQHTYAAAGIYTVTVTATGGSTSKTASKTITIAVGGPAPPSAAATVTGATINPFNGAYDVDAGSTVTLSATEADANAISFAWAFSDGGTATGRTATHAFARPGSESATLTVTGDGTNRVGTATATFSFKVAAPDFQAIMIPGAGSIDSESGTWATDLSVTNPGTGTTTVTLYFAAFSDAIPSDLSTLPFNSLNSIPLSGGQSWSGIDIVRNPLGRGGDGKGILFLKYDGGNATPIVTARVYFTAQGSSYGTALPSFVVGPYGQTQAQGIEATTGQTLTGLRNDSLYRFNVSLFNASSEGGQFHVDAFSEDGAQVGSHDFAVLPYSQAGVNDTDLIAGLDSSKRYVLNATGTTGALQAYASQLDRRNNDLVQVADDTPRQNVPPGTLVNYYMSGVGRIEEGSAHWRTDLRFFNPSTLQRTIFLEYHYTPVGSTTEQIVLAPLAVGAGQGISLDDIVGNYLDDFSPADLKTGTILGLLKVYYFAPTDIVTAPLIIGGRIYADLPTGTAGMQLAVYTQSQSVSPGSAVLIMPGAQSNLRFRTNIGLFTLGDLPTIARISAVRQDGTVMSTYDYQLNNPGQTGAFAQIPMTALPSIDGNPMTIKVQSVSGSPVGAYIVTVDQISSDTVFIQGKPIS